MTAFSKRRRKWCQDLGWSEPWTRTALECRRLRGTVVVRTWVNRRRGVVRGLGSLDQAQRQAVGRVLLAIAWVERRQDVGLDVGWRHGISGQGFGSRRQGASFGRSLVKRRL